jgi:hypothetical protein
MNKAGVKKLRHPTQLNMIASAQNRHGCGSSGFKCTPKNTTWFERHGTGAHQAKILLLMIIILGKGCMHAYAS